jgi:hypothetical protein
LEKRDAIHHRHLQIEEHESRIVGLEVRESFLAVGRLRDTEALGT